MTKDSSSASTPIPCTIHRWVDGECCRDEDAVAEEAPLEIRIHGVSIAVVMRTPGHDEELVTGFLLTERIVASRDHIASVRHETAAPTPVCEDNIVHVTLREGTPLDWHRWRRNTFASSSCGICGKGNLAVALATGDAVPTGLQVSPQVLAGFPTALRAHQALFSSTGGLHAAGVFTPSGELVVVREDVGRHNAVDKVIGFLAREGRSFGDHILFLSGRISFEMVQKSVAVGLPIVAGISAPTSLAVSLGQTHNVTVAGFVREGRFNVYSAPGRIP